MAWQTEVLRSETEALVLTEARYPYLSSLLASRPEDTGLVRQRIRNYLRAREDERTCGDVSRGLPYHVILDPSSVCTLRCPLCVHATDPTGRRRMLLERDRTRRLLARLAPHAIRVDLFNWGEPLLNPHFTDIAREAAARSLFTRTSSHMSHPRGFDAGALVGSGLRYLVASLDGATQATYERYRVGGNLALALENLRALLRAREAAGSRRPLVEWQFLVFDHNQGEVDAARDLARALGVDVFRHGGARGRMATKVLTSSPVNVGASADLLLPPSHPASEYDGAGRKRRRYEEERCWWLWGKVSLQPDGGILPCWSGWFQQHDLGNWHSEDLAEVWNGPAYQQARRAAREGGDPAGALLCERCAAHRSFVPTPDGDGETEWSARDVDTVVDALTAAGEPPHPDVAGTVRECVATRAAAGSPRDRPRP